MQAPAVIVPVDDSTVTRPARASPTDPRRRRVQANVQAGGQPACHEGADAAVRHQVAAVQRVAPPVAGAEPGCVHGANHRPLPRFDGRRPRILGQRFRDGGEGDVAAIAQQRGRRRFEAAPGPVVGGGFLVRHQPRSPT